MTLAQQTHFSLEDLCSHATSGSRPGRLSLPEVLSLSLPEVLSFRCFFVVVSFVWRVVVRAPSAALGVHRHENAG